MAVSHTVLFAILYNTIVFVLAVDIMLLISVNVLLLSDAVTDY